MKIPKLKVRTRKTSEGLPCAVELFSMLNCWSVATGGADAPKCADAAIVLKSCMKHLPPSTKKVNSVNYHLARLGKQV